MGEVKPLWLLGAFSWHILFWCTRLAERALETRKNIPIVISPGNAFMMTRKRSFKISISESKRHYE